jgi:hypothetical protein
MSLSSFLRIADVTAKLKLLRPKLSRKIAATLRVEPKTDHHAIVGAAFDYLLRFELQRLAPHAVSEPWVAEQVPDLIYSDSDTWWNVVRSDNPEHDLPEIRKRTWKSVVEAKAAVAAYMKLRKPNRIQRVELASHALRMAKLDVVVRALQLDPSFEVADPEDVEDLLSLLAVVPFDALLHEKILLLNPHFRQISDVVDGAEADLITGDMLVDFKTIKAEAMEVDHLDQLLGYYFLVRHLRQVDPTFPVVNKLAIYFCRHGYLWSADATVWSDNPLFLEVEEWFFKRAKEVFRHRKNT